MLPEHDYKKLDTAHKYQYAEDRLKQAHELGYSFISQCTVEEYRKLKSTSKVAVLFKMSAAGIASELKQFGEPMQPPGGFRPGDRRYGHRRWNPLRAKDIKL